MNNERQLASSEESTTIRGWLESDKLRGQIAQALPRHVTADRFLRILFTQCQKIPRLMNCTRESLFAAIIACSQLGIEPDGRRAHLIPYGTTCQLIIDYKGLAELAYRSGLISSLHADVVCAQDDFEYDLGDLKRHKIDFRKPRGEMYAVYARVRFKDGSEKSEVMDKSQIDSIRARSKAGNSGPWVTDYNEMAKKTVFRRLSKWLPLSPEQRDALDLDDDVSASIEMTPKISRPLFSSPVVTPLEAEATHPDLEAVPGLKPAGQPLAPWQELAAACTDAGLAEADVAGYACGKNLAVDTNDEGQPYMNFRAIPPETARVLIAEFAEMEKVLKKSKSKK